MKAGRDLDALIAEKVMGWKLVTERVGTEDLEFFKTPSSLYHHYYQLPHYSTDIADAWEVVEKMGGTFGLMKIEGLKNHQAHFGMNDWVDGITAPHAICLAALRAVGVELD